MDRSDESTWIFFDEVIYQCEGAGKVRIGVRNAHAGVKAADGFG
jgi:hypothetical protein